MWRQRNTNLRQPVSAKRTNITALVTIITVVITMAVVIPVMVRAVNGKPNASHSTGTSTPAPRVSIPADMVGTYSGKYVVDDDEPTDWVGKATVEIANDGKVSGYIWLPTNDGGPGIISIVDGQVEPSGRVTIRSDATGVAGADGILQGELIRRFQFMHEGKVLRQNGTASITTYSTATASRCNERMSICRTM